MLMALQLLPPTRLLLLLISLLVFISHSTGNGSASLAHAQMAEDAASGRGLDLMLSESLEWPAYPFALEEDMAGGGEEGDVDDELAKSTRRSLFWHRMRYYISYAALSANRVPCPPRSGRSYYTHNCYRARGPVHPYSRNCETIARCRR